MVNTYNKSDSLTNWMLQVLLVIEEFNIIHSSVPCYFAYKSCKSL